MNEQRLIAEEDPAVTYTNDEALAWIERAETALAGFVSADEEESKSFAIHLLADPRQQRPERAETDYPARRH